MRFSEFGDGYFIFFEEILEHLIEIVIKLFKQ